MPLKAPDPGLVEELATAFHTRFPSLSDVKVAQAWGGWIAITSSWVSVAGQLEDKVYYSICCNGHGLAQAPYIGSLIADYIIDGTRHEDLQVIWKDTPTFPPFMMMGPRGLRSVWALDRLCDLVNGGGRRARRAALRLTRVVLKGSTGCPWHESFEGRLSTDRPVWCAARAHRVGCWRDQRFCQRSSGWLPLPQGLLTENPCRADAVPFKLGVRMSHEIRWCAHS